MLRSSSSGGGPVRFAAFELDLHNGELRKHGIRIRLQDQPLQLLQILLEQPGSVVTRDELQRRLWPSDTYVEFDKGIYNAIKRLRETLGDDADHPRYVETIPRRGYRFIAPLEPTLPSPQPSLRDDFSRVSDAPRPIRRHATLFLTLGIFLSLLLFLFVRPSRTSRSTASSPSFTDVRLLRLTDSPPENPVHFASISPDGNYIAYTDSSGIHVKIIRTGEVKTYSPPADDPSAAPAPDASALFPVSWFPDGSTLLVSTRPGPSVWSISLITGAEHKLFTGGWGSAVSPDGSWIAVVKQDTEIWIVGAHGEPAQLIDRVEPGNQFGRVIWNPDSQRLAFFKIYNLPLVMECSLESRDIRLGLPAVILRGSDLCEEQAQSFWWAPDGRILFSRREQSGGPASNLWEVRTEPRTGAPLGSPRRVTNWGGFFVAGVSGSQTGNRVIFLRSWFPNQIEIVEPASASSKNLPRGDSLPAPDHTAWITGWAPGGDALIYHTDRNGNDDIYRQKLGSESAEPLVVSSGEQLSAQVTPDGSSLLYIDLPSFHRFGADTPVRIMRIPLSGGAPELVLSTNHYYHYVCPRVPSSFCVLGERSSDETHVSFYEFNPLQTVAPGELELGKARELASLDVQAGQSYNWSLSPDGSSVAFLQTTDRETPIRLLSLAGGGRREIPVHGWRHFNGISWSADGSNLLVSSRSTVGCALLRVDLHGSVRVLRQTKGAYQIWAIPSPDGRLLAIMTATQSRDVWMAENL